MCIHWISYEYSLDIIGVSGGYVGGTKNQFQEWEDDQPRRDWIEDQYGLVEEDMHTQEWKDASQEYDIEMQISEQISLEEAFDAEMENFWDSFKDYGDAHFNFKTQMKELQTFVASSDGVMEQKMACSHAVTLMGTCIQEMLVISSDMINSANFAKALVIFKSLRTKNIKLSDLLDLDIESHLVKVFKAHVTEVNPHNIQEVISVFCVIYDQKLPVKILKMQGAIRDFIRLRNDVAHRNGLKQDGTGSHQFTRAIVQEKLNLVEGFIDELASWLIQQDDDEEGF